MSNLDKKTIINMENTARYQTRSKLNIAFSTADRDSAVFVFNVTKNNKPLLLSEQNVLGHIAFSHSDKSFVKTTLDFTEHNINGQFEVHVPNDLLKRPGTVTMQVYVAEKGNSEVIVAERILTFKIEKSIVSEISAETSLQYIIEFDELLEQVNQRMVAINDSMANAEDYVSLINQAKEQGLSDIEIARSTSIQEINTLVANKLQELETKGNQYSTKFDNDKAEMDSKKEEFDLAVQGSGLVTTSQSSNWQKHKLTNDDGRIKQINGLDFNDPEELLGEKSQFIYVSDSKNYIENSNGTVSYIVVTNNYKRIEYRPNGTNKVFYKNKEDGLWLDWYDPIQDAETTTGSQSKANVAESNAKTYANELVGSKTTLLFEGTANGVGTTINLSETLDNFVVLIIYVSFPGGLVPILGSPYGTNDIPLNLTNLTDATGSGGGIYEAVLTKNTRTQLSINNDVSFDIAKLLGSGAGANKIKITRIVGVRK